MKRILLCITIFYSSLSVYAQSYTRDGRSNSYVLTVQSSALLTGALPSLSTYQYAYGLYDTYRLGSLQAEGSYFPFQDAPQWGIYGKTTGQYNLSTDESAWEHRLGVSFRLLEFVISSGVMQLEDQIGTFASLRHMHPFHWVRVDFVTYPSQEELARQTYVSTEMYVNLWKNGMAIWDDIWLTGIALVQTHDYFLGVGAAYRLPVQKMQLFFGMQYVVSNDSQGVRAHVQYIN